MGHGRSGMELSARPGYRADIDGLRAVAVLSVLAFHYGAGIRGGFTGVDVFFVISGFLITQVLATEIAAGKFSVVGFYDRRMRRILPALLTMLAAVLLAGRLLLSPGDYVSLANSTAAAAFGVSNFFFHAHTGYFDQVADLMPLLHTWSLAVEEQFYVVWPLLLLALAAVSSRIPVAATLGVIVVIGCAGSIAYFQYFPKAAFYMALPRAWELALGALLAFLPALSRAVGEIAALLGLVLIAIGFTISPGKFPGQFALYPCVGAALIIWPRAQTTISSRLLGSLAPIGLISYSLYLWHWPVWVYFRIYINNGQPSAAEAIALAIASIILATLSYRYVERPFRKPLWSAPRTVAAGFACVVTIFCASMYVDSADGLPQRLPAEAQAMRSLDVMWEWPCKDSAIEGIPGLYCVFGAPWQTAKRKTMIWGDSHAQHFAPILDAINADPERSFLVFAGCPPVLGDELSLVIPDAERYADRCKRYYSNGVKLLKEDTSITRVIFTSNWYELPWRIQGNSLHGLPAMSSALTKLITETSAPDRRFLLIGMVPHLPAEIVECAIRDSSKLLRRPCVSVVRASDALAVKQTTAPTDAMLVEVANALPNVAAIIPSEKLCRNDACEVSLDGEFLYRDQGHIRRNLHLQTKRDFADRIGLTAALAGDRQDAAVRPDLAGAAAR
jgi:peptidoglycan/LPS O-acetylase OafA/YrhL